MSTMASDLPNEFDVIVLGTGLPETLLAAAFSRIGLSVLHLDRNAYYCGSWASFSLRSIPDWIKQQQEAQCYVSAVDEDKLSTLVKEGERALQLPEKFPVISDSTSRYHVDKRPEEETETCKSSSPSSPSTTNDAHVPPPTTQPADTSSPSPTTQPADTNDTPSSTPTSQPANTSNNTQTDKQSNETADPDNAQSAHTDSASEKNSDVVPGQFDSVPEEEESPSSCNPGQDCESGDQQAQTEAAVEEKQREWFQEDVEKDWRKYSIDLAPKLLYCSGSMVELLIVSDVAKYCEFRTVSRILTLRDNKLEKVPCSRADVFSSKALSLLEKRLLMKFLTFAADFDKQPDEYKDFGDKPFVEFLASKKLSTKIQHFVLHSIAMATETTPTQQGLESTQKFLRSLGRYGNTAFLFPLYGSGELPQGYCRLSAVFGGVYVLTLSVSHLLVNTDNKCTGVITSAGQRIACKYLIADPSYLMKDFYRVPDDSYISRGIYITDTSIFPGESEELSLLQFPHEGQLSSPSTSVLELPPSAMVSPRPLYLVHMTRRAVSDVKTDLQPVTSTLFLQDDSESDSNKPRVLWSLTFQQRDLSAVDRTQQTPDNVFVVTGPGLDLDTDRCVAEAKAIFKEMCPDEEFLPKPPHPDDIIYVDTEEVSATGNEQGDWVTNDSDLAEVTKEGQDPKVTEGEDSEVAGGQDAKVTQVQEVVTEDQDTKVAEGDKVVDVKREESIEEKGLTEGEDGAKVSELEEQKDAEK